MVHYFYVKWVILSFVNEAQKEHPDKGLELLDSQTRFALKRILCSLSRLETYITLLILFIPSDLKSEKKDRPIRTTRL